MMSQKESIAVILALPMEYNTSSNVRSKCIIEALRDKGYKIKCYMPYPQKNSVYYSRDRMIDGVDIFRYGKLNDNIQHNNDTHDVSIKNKQIGKFIRGLIKKIDVFGSTICYYPYWKQISNDIKKNGFDVILSFSDPLTAHLLGRKCKEKNKKVNYIQQWGDPLASDIVSKTTQPLWLKKMVEYYLISKADKICYVSPFTLREQKKMYHSESDKMVFIPTPSVDYKIAYNELPKDHISIGYFGSYNRKARNILPFYQAAIKNKDIKFYIIGDSDEELAPSDNVFLANRIDSTLLNEYIANVDAIVCLMNKKGNQIPGKIYHDASLKQDILLIKDGDMKDDIQKFFENYHHYTFVDNDVNAISSVFEDYLINGVPIREPVKEFSADYVAEKLINIIR